MKNIICIVTIFISSLTLTAQNDQRAKNLLNEVSAKAKTYNNIEIGFTYTLRNQRENINQETRGKVILSGDKYVLELMGTTMIFDGTHLHTIVPEDEEITISKHNPNDEDALTPARLLTFYETGYSYKWDIVQNVGGRQIQFIELKPTRGQNDIRDILLGIDTRTKHIYKLIQRQTNGTEIILTVNSFKANQNIPSSMFRFDPNRYRNYYINRLD